MKTFIYILCAINFIQAQKPTDAQLFEKAITSFIAFEAANPTKHCNNTSRALFFDYNFWSKKEYNQEFLDARKEIMLQTELPYRESAEYTKCSKHNYYQFETENSRFDAVFYKERCFVGDKPIAVLEVQPFLYDEASTEWVSTIEDRNIDRSCSYEIRISQNAQGELVANIVLSSVIAM